MEMRLLDQLRMAARGEVDPEGMRRLAANAADTLTVYDSVARDLRASVEKHTTAAAGSGEFENLRVIASTMDYLSHRSNGHVMIRYDQMDPNDPDGEVRLEICPHCKRPAKPRKRKHWTTYVHVAWPRKKGKPRPRDYCKVFRDDTPTETGVDLSQVGEGPA
jgi:hypothetical protein